MRLGPGLQHHRQRAGDEREVEHDEPVVAAAWQLNTRPDPGVGHNAATAHTTVITINCTRLRLIAVCGVLNRPKATMCRA